MRPDISDYLAEWPYDKDNDTRVIKGKDGKGKIQIRSEFGMSQFEIDGRPDGKRPFGKESLLEYYVGKLEAYKRINGIDIGFSLDSEVCEALGEESALIQQRYSGLMKLKDFERAARDTEHNLKIFDLMETYGEKNEDRLYFEAWRPRLIRANRDAKIQLCIQHEDYDKALEYANEAIRTLNDLNPLFIQLSSIPVLKLHPVFAKRLEEALELFRRYIPKIRKMKKENKPETEKKKDRLREAVAREDFETAARLRDEINELSEDSRLE